MPHFVFINMHLCYILIPVFVTILDTKTKKKLY